jgi:hypothetical protein
VVGLILIAVGGVWNSSALIAAAIVIAVLIIPWRRLPFGQWLVPLVFLVLAVLYPFYYTHLFGSPIFGPAPGMDTMVVMMVFTMMALGLNFVVGYAGLLDLGYVAFYALGAYTSGWLASSQFASRKFHFGAVGIGPDAPGFHISIWLILIVAGFTTALIGVLIGLPTLRLRGDYPRDRHARLRRDHPADRQQRRQLLRHGVQPDGRNAGHHAHRRPGLRQLDPRPPRLTRELPQPADGELLPSVLLDVARPRPHHGVLLLASP